MIILESSSSSVTEDVVEEGAVEEKDEDVGPGLGAGGDGLHHGELLLLLVPDHVQLDAHTTHTWQSTQRYNDRTSVFLNARF